MIKYPAVLSLLFFSACFAQKKSSLNYFEYGRTRSEVVSHITGRNELILGEFNVPRGHVEVYQYGKVGQMEAKQDRYILYFLNDTLIRRSGPEPLESGTTLGIKEYYKSKRIKEEQREEREMLRKEEEERRMRKRDMQERRMDDKNTGKRAPRESDSRRRLHKRRNTRDDEDY